MARPKKGIFRIEWKWKDCTSAFTYCRTIPLFSTGGGSVQNLGFPDLWEYQKHFYIYKWCFVTVNGIRKIK